MVLQQLMKSGSMILTLSANSIVCSAHVGVVWAVHRNVFRIMHKFAWSPLGSS